MTGPLRIGRWVALLWVLMAAFSLLLCGCSSEADQGATKAETTTTLAPAPVPKPTAEPKQTPKTQQKSPTQPAEPPKDPAALLEQARQSLVQSQETQALRQIDQAARALWQRLPLQLSQAILVREPAKGYGTYQPRQDGVYLIASPDRPVFPGKGQPIYIYLEPVNYGVKELAGGRWEISFAMDVDLLDAQGKQLFGKKDFMRVQSVSRHFNRQFFLNVTVNLKGAPTGAYELRLTLKDQVSQQQAVATLPVKLAMAPLEKR
ncbi:MAG: hypothetical protein KQI62_21265 [Deltaproteobacteria bacterium]|nr:hypothetical protein [Deltaproteobacteria bacterium]